MSNRAIPIVESMAESERTPPAEQTTGTVVELTVPPEEFVLAETLEAIPEAEIACERVVESGYESVLPLIWVCGVEREDLDAALADDPSVERATLLTGADDRWLYQMRWDDTIEFVAGLTTDPRTTIVDLRGPDPEWSLHLLYGSRDELSESIARHEAGDVSFEVASIQQLGDESSRELVSRAGADARLTSKQAAALQAAHEHGYFGVPRESCLTELAADLDISHQTLSERLRRGSRELIEDTIMADPVFEGADS